jgi:hypothetical protein
MRACSTGATLTRSAACAAVHPSVTMHKHTARPLAYSAAARIANGAESFDNRAHPRPSARTVALCRSRHKARIFGRYGVSALSWSSAATACGSTWAWGQFVIIGGAGCKPGASRGSQMVATARASAAAPASRPATGPWPRNGPGAIFYVRIFPMDWSPARNHAVDLLLTIVRSSRGRHGGQRRCPWN